MQYFCRKGKPGIVFIKSPWQISDTKEDHDHSLKIDGSMELISKALPLLDGKPEGTALEVIGGKGSDF